METNKTFENIISSEDNACNYIRKKREEQGIKCLGCGSNRFYFDEHNRRWVCKDCKKELSLVTGTVMHSSQLSRVYWLKVIYRFANTDGITNSKDIASIEDKQSYLLTDILRKIRLVISKYADDNKKKFESKKIKDITLHGAQSTYRCLYENELKFKMSIKACNDQQKFEKLLSVCLMYKNEFRHNNYGKKQQALKNPTE